MTQPPDADEDRSEPRRSAPAEGALPAGVAARPRVPLPVRLIAIGKGVKASLFLIAGLALSRLMRAPDLRTSLREWLAWIHIDPDSHLINRAIDAVSGIHPHELAVFGVGSFVYATLYGIEGFGLWFGKAWAEWMTSVSTLLFIPVEIHHLIVKPSAGIASVLIINVVVVVYLVRLVLRRRADEHAAGSHPRAR